MTSVNCVGIVLLVVAIYAAICVKSETEPDDKLIFAHILFRHGDQNIIRPYKNDPYKDEQRYWPEGFGQLTKSGKQRAYELGKFLRQRYSSLLPKDGSYDPNNIYVQCTDSNRTIMTANCVLAGMFSVNNYIGDDCPPEQPVPINVIPKNRDHLLHASRKCAFYDADLNSVLAQENKDLNENDKPLIEYLAEHTGEDIRGYRELTEIYDILWIEDHNNFTLPPWAKQVFYYRSHMDDLVEDSYDFETYTSVMRRLKSGFLIRDMLEHFSMKINSTLSPDRSLWVYSAHDSTIFNLMRSLSLFRPVRNPTFTACFLFELHQTSAGYHVEIFYKRQLGSEIDVAGPLAIRNCGRKCPLNKMYELYKYILPINDFDTECQNNINDGA